MEPRIPYTRLPQRSSGSSERETDSFFSNTTASLAALQVEAAKAHIDDYSYGTASTSPSRSAGPSRALGIKDVLDALGCSELYEDTCDRISDRDGFLDAFASQLRTCSLECEDGWKSTITLEELVGSKNVKLYEDAIREESQSRAFREAVVLAGVATFAALRPTWTRPKHFIIGGSSGAGKTFAAKTIIKALMQSDDGLRPFFYAQRAPHLAQPVPIQYFVSVDGGDARATSQIRKLVLQCALVLGYKGISDLHERTKIDIKKYIKAAAFGSGIRPVHVVEPRTFADITQETYAKVAYDTERVIFCMVYTPEEVIEHQGEARAWYSGKNGRPPPAYIQLNNPDVGCESKAYSSSALSWGRAKSKGAMAHYASALGKGAGVIVTLTNNASVSSQGDIQYAAPDIEISYGHFSTSFGILYNETLRQTGNVIRLESFDADKSQAT